jgi:hypothetical protein
LFLPLFPFSILLNVALTRLRHPAARFVLLLVWPQAGILALSVAHEAVPQGFIAWALISSGFYALRLLTVRDLGLWAGFLASSALPLTWGLAKPDASLLDMQLFALWFSLPAALLALLTGPLAKRYGAAYAGLYGGLAYSVPRLSGLLVATVLAAIATPPSPGFMAMLNLLHRLGWPAAPGVLLIWLLWGWAATKLLQGFVFGVDRPDAVTDIGRTSTAVYTGALGAFIVTGLYLSGGVL